MAEAETIGLPYEIDKTKPNAKHAPKPENRRRKIDPYAIAAIRLLILTGARLNEVLKARWDYIDFDRGLMNLATPKTGKKSIFLSAAALEVLADLPPWKETRTSFPAIRTASLALTRRNPGRP